MEYLSGQLFRHRRQKAGREQLRADIHRLAGGPKTDVSGEAASDYRDVFAPVSIKGGMEKKTPLPS